MRTDLIWYIPAACGDFSLEGRGTGSVLHIKDPTPSELIVLGRFREGLLTRGWARDFEIPEAGECDVEIDVGVAESGALLVMDNSRGRLTAVRSISGEVRAVQATTVEELVRAVNEAVAPAAPLVSSSAIEQAPGPTPEPPKPPTPPAVATVRRPTTCCPFCVDGPDIRASKVLDVFCTPEQRESWRTQGYLWAVGHLSGHRYRIHHRHHPLARKYGKITIDEDGMREAEILHCWDWRVPPAEEVLSVKLILEHRENWLRCSATLLSGPRFESGLGGILDGTQDASIFSHAGLIMDVLRVEPPNVRPRHLTKQWSSDED